MNAVSPGATSSIAVAQADQREHGRSACNRRNSRGRRLQRSRERRALRQFDPVAVGIAHHRNPRRGAQRHRRARLAAAMGQHVSMLAIDLEHLERDVAPALALEGRIVGRIRRWARRSAPCRLRGRSSRHRLRPARPAAVQAPRCRSGDAPRHRERQDEFRCARSRTCPSAPARHDCLPDRPSAAGAAMPSRAINSSR